MNKDEIVLPRPVNGPVYDGWTLERWLLKVCEETGEVVTAYKNLKSACEKYHDFVDGLSIDDMTDPKAAYASMLQVNTQNTRMSLCRELTDVITAATSTLEYLGVDLDERQRLQQSINESNAKRDGGRRFRA